MSIWRKCFNYRGAIGLPGGLSIQQDHSKGIIYFRDGEIVHAEQGAIRGMDAIYIMLGWKEGDFSCQPELEAATVSITMPLPSVA